MSIMKTQSSTTTNPALKAYEDKIQAQLQQAKAQLDMAEAQAREKKAQTEITVINDLHTARQDIDRRLQDLKTTHDSHVARAKSDIDGALARFKASVDGIGAKLKTHSATK
jgi:outer membrane protein TolC